MEEKKTSPSSSTLNGNGHDQVEQKKTPGYVAGTQDVSRNNLNALFENPLGGIPRDQLMADVDDFCAKFDLMNYNELFRKAALVAQNPHSVSNMTELSEDDKYHLEREHTHKWAQPKMLYYLVRWPVTSPNTQGES